MYLLSVQLDTVRHEWFSFFIFFEQRMLGYNTHMNLGHGRHVYRASTLTFLIVLKKNTSDEVTFTEEALFGGMILLRAAVH
jgi:hypothetical protein